jgi:hypothetical protein
MVVGCKARILVSCPAVNEKRVKRKLTLAISARLDSLWRNESKSRAWIKMSKDVSPRMFDTTIVEFKERQTNPF